MESNNNRLQQLKTAFVIMAFMLVAMFIFGAIAINAVFKHDIDTFLIMLCCVGVTNRAMDQIFRGLK